VTTRPAAPADPSEADRGPASADGGAGAGAPPGAPARHPAVKVILRVLPIAAVAVFAALTVAVCRSLPSPHLKVELHNDTNAPMADVHFVFADGKGLRQSETVPAGGQVVWDVTGDSHGFSVDYRDDGGQRVTRKCDFYFDGDQWGTIALHVKRGGMKVLTEVDAPPQGAN
jgi:hypothetical protein